MELIDRHLDQHLDWSDREQFESRLVSDPEFAREFARATRLEHSLEESLRDDAREQDLAELVGMITDGPQQPRKVPRLAKVTAIAAAVALCFGLVLLRLQPEPDEATETTAAPAGKVIERPSVRLEQTRLTAILPKRAETGREAEARIRQRLSRYYLPQTTIEDLPLDQALASLQQTFYSVDQLEWTDDESITFELASSAGEIPRVTLTRSNISTLSALTLLAIQSGHEVSLAPPKIRLVKQPPSPDQAEERGYVLRSFNLTPELVTSGPYREPVTHDLHDSPEWRVEPAVTTFDPGQIVAAWGVEMPDGASAVFTAQPPQLLLRNTPSNLGKFANLVAEATATTTNSSPITVSAKLVSLPPELSGVADRIVNADEWQVIVREWSTQQDVDLLSAPKVVTRIAEEVKVEILTARPLEVNEDLLPDPSPEPATEPDPEMMVGLRLPFQAHVTGEQITLVGQIDQAFHEDEIPPATLAQLGGSDPDTPIVRFVTDFEAPLYPGQVALFECECPDSGKKLVAAVTADWGTNNAPSPPGLEDFRYELD